jgi:hypothetical protein
MRYDTFADPDQAGVADADAAGDRYGDTVCVQHLRERAIRRDMDFQAAVRQQYVECCAQPGFRWRRANVRAVQSVFVPIELARRGDYGGDERGIATGVQVGIWWLASQKREDMDL